jgi:hypothetical protein
MSKKLFPILPPLVAALQIGYRFNNLSGVFSKPLLDINAYQVFTNEVRIITLFLGLSIMLGVLFLQIPNQKMGESRFWYAGFLATLLIATVSVAYVNPHRKFPWNKRDHYLEVEVRSRKIDLYRNLKRAPDLVMFGSSVTFLEPTTYFQDKWGIQAFNMSLNMGGPVDFVNLIHIIKAKSPDAKMPKVITVEMLGISYGLSDVELSTPLEYLPYMDSTDQQMRTLWTNIRDVLDLNSFSDSLFTLLIVEKGRWAPVTILTEDGTMIRSDKDVKNSEYKGAIAKNIQLMGGMQTCASINERGKAAVERMVQLSREYKFSLLFYRAPLNEDFYKFSKTQPSDYSKCNELFDQYLEGIAAQNPNVFFKDLSQYREIAAGGKNLYIDTHHLNTKGSMMLLDVLSPEIENALQWANENRP